MKRNLTTIAFLFHSIIYAQFQGIHLEKDAVFFVNRKTLTSVYGSVELKGIWKNRGNVMLKGNSNSVFRTLKNDGSIAQHSDIINSTSGKLINLLNNPDNFSLPNTTNDGNNYTYGQLYITNYQQSNITGFVSEEYRNVNHGAYQQIGLPFSNKNLNELSTELGKTFTTTRWSQNEILKWNNTNVVFDYLDFSNPLNNPSGYYVLGNKNNSLDLYSSTKEISGIPYTDGNLMIESLQNAGNGINYGTNGTNSNQYRERYNSYLQDGFELHSAIGGVAWQGNYGRNIYHFANPFLTNIDLRNIFIDEISGDGVFLSNIYAIRLEQASGTVSYTPGVGSGAASFRYVTWDNATNSPVGDVDWLIVRPLGTFVIKLKDNLSPQTLNFNNLRRFNYTPRTNNNYSVTTARTATPSNTVKQLGIIALDTYGNEIGRTYYVVSENAKSGHQNNANLQITASSNNVIGTFEENILGGYDENYTSKYWLYINEANETDFKGKAIPMLLFSPVKSLKFELRENGEITNNLSSGESFYYAIDNYKKIEKDIEVPLSINSSLGINIYYGTPENKTLSVNEKFLSRTMIIYNQDIDKYIIKFDKNWKSASLFIYDTSGRLIVETKKINTTSDFTINSNLSSGIYIAKIIAPNGEQKTTKIIIR